MTSLSGQTSGSTSSGTWFTGGSSGEVAIGTLESGSGGTSSGQGGDTRYPEQFLRSGRGGAAGLGRLGTDTALLLVGRGPHTAPACEVRSCANRGSRCRAAESQPRRPAARGGPSAEAGSLRAGRRRADPGWVGAAPRDSERGGLCPEAMPAAGAAAAGSRCERRQGRHDVGRRALGAPLECRQSDTRGRGGPHGRGNARAQGAPANASGTGQVDDQGPAGRRTCAQGAPVHAPGHCLASVPALVKGGRFPVFREDFLALVRATPGGGFPGSCPSYPQFSGDGCGVLEVASKAGIGCYPARPGCPTAWRRRRRGRRGRRRRRGRRWRAMGPRRHRRSAGGSGASPGCLHSSGRSPQLPGECWPRSSAAERGGPVPWPCAEGEHGRSPPR